jgi:hypothetical protein
VTDGKPSSAVISPLLPKKKDLMYYALQKQLLSLIIISDTFSALKHKQTSKRATTGGKNRKKKRLRT